MFQSVTSRRGAIVEAVIRREIVLMEGAVIERLRHEADIRLDPRVANTGLVYDEQGRGALQRIWRSYLDVACDAGLPMMICAPTWRATPERLEQAGLPAAAQVCADAVQLASEVREEYATAGVEIFLAGLMGCRGDAYRPDEALGSSAAELFHAEQAAALADAGVDLILAATLPSASEALGLARAIAATDVPFIIGFVLRPDGTLLDGAPLGDAVVRLDGGLQRPALGYAGTCVHPDNFAQALGTASARDAAGRFVALQGNGSRLLPEELDGRAELDSDAPESFGASMATVRERFGIGIVGGCCGTNERHIAALAAELGGAGNRRRSRGSRE